MARAPPPAACPSPPLCECALRGIIPGGGTQRATTSDGPTRRRPIGRESIYGIVCACITMAHGVCLCVCVRVCVCVRGRDLYMCARIRRDEAGHGGKAGSVLRGDL